MHAKEAKDISITKKAKQLLEKMDKAIRLAVESGNLQATVDVEMYNQVVIETVTKELEAKHYRVGYSQGYSSYRSNDSTPARLTANWDHV